MVCGRLHPVHLLAKGSTASQVPGKRSERAWLHMMQCTRLQERMLVCVRACMHAYASVLYTHPHVHTWIGASAAMVCEENDWV